MILEMTTVKSAFEVLDRYEDTKVYLESVQESADANRDSFGFLPSRVYAEFARNGCLYVLVEKTRDGCRYAGHLMFSLRYPVARVVQAYSDPKFRRQGLAAHLIKYFCGELTKLGFSSVYASVAEDLREANSFWERQQFYIQTIRKGGETRKRQILRRCRELDSPQLIPSSGLTGHDPLGLASCKSNEASLYLLDLNVLFDLTGPRRVRHEQAVSLFQAERMNVCSLAISNEIREELRRTATKGKIDPMEGVIDILPMFPLKELDFDEPLFGALAQRVFPEKSQLTSNDKSDLRHIATAIQYKLSGLITNDQAVLDAGPELKARYGIEVLSPEAFVVADVEPLPSVFEGLGASELVLSSVSDSHVAEIHAFLSAQGIDAATVALRWMPTGASSLVVARFGVWNGDKLIGYGSWTAASTTSTIVARVAVDCSNPHAQDASRVLIRHLMERLPQQGPRRINLEMPPSHAILREVAISLGFRGDQRQSGLFKIVLGGVLTKCSWGTLRHQLDLNSQIKLPEQIPVFHHPDQQIPIVGPDGNRHYVAMSELESLLAPALFSLPGRPAIITPIQRSFSEPLLGHSPQCSLLPVTRVALLEERSYFCAPKNLPLFSKGSLVLFYESGRRKGRCAIIAIARVRQSYIKHMEKLSAEDFESSVLNSSSVSSVGKSQEWAVATFDNVFVLPRPVPLETLRRIGCGKATQLISTNRISDEQLQEILKEAWAYE